MLKYILSALLSLSLAAPALAQSQAANGAIEGTVSDSSGGVLPGVTVTVTNIENVEFGVPRLAANGAAMRINYMIDGNTNTEKDRAGLRLLPMSEVMIQEVKVVTTGFAPEFGQTMGMVYNAVTPSGTNTFKGEASYLFRRKSFSAFPFFFRCATIAVNCPSLDTVIAS